MFPVNLTKFQRTPLGDCFCFLQIRNVFSHLKKTVVKKLLLIHAWGESMFNQGKKNAILNLIEKENSKVIDICGIFDNPSVIQLDNGKAGIRLFTVMYGIACLLCFSIRIFNVFQTSVSSACSRKTWENCWFPDVFRGCLEKGFY